LKAVHHIVASSAEIIGAFNTGFDTVNLRRLTDVGSSQNSIAGSATSSSPMSSACQILLATSLHGA